ncbi:MAG: SprT family zinc-dependent metalloprotease [Pseudomonadota bacterium]
MLGRLRKSAPLPRTEQRAALLAGKQISYTLKRSGNRRSIGLRIDDRGLTVSVPLRASEKWLNSVLQEKAHWVVEKLEGWQSCMPATINWRDGEAIDYLGEQLILRVEHGLFATPVQRLGKELWVYLVNGNITTQVAQAVSSWYQAEALQLFQLRVAHYAPLLNVMPRAVKLTKAKTQWGSCTAAGSVRLNVQLIKLPVRLLDYVVVHELAHLRELNHSTSFWRVVESACPDYANLRDELKAVHIR